MSDDIETHIFEGFEFYLSSSAKNLILGSSYCPANIYSDKS